MSIPQKFLYDDGTFDQAELCPECQERDGLHFFNNQYLCSDCVYTVRAQRVEELRAATEAGSRIATGEEIVQRAAERAIEEMRAWLDARAA